MNLNEQLEAWFSNFEHQMNTQVPELVAQTATQYFKERFSLNNKDWDGIKWKPALKPPKGNNSLMIKTSALMSSIRPTLESPERVTISAGSSKVPYAQIHNEGGTITLPPRSETFQRNRIQSGKAKGRFKKGRIEGKQGFTFKQRTINMPKRQFMGYSEGLNKAIITRLTNHFNTK